MRHFKEFDGDTVEDGGFGFGRKTCQVSVSAEDVACEIRVVIELAWFWDELDEWKIGNVADIRSERGGKNL